MKNIIRIASRNSPLALKQANLVKDLLSSKNHVEIISMTSSGDTVSSKIFKKYGGKGLFLKELEEALLQKRCDIAVHSLKDVPAIIDKRFKIMTVSKRENSSDVLVSNKYNSLDEMPKNAKIGTSSPRRVALLKTISKSFKLIDIRGNIQTRIKKMTEKNIDGLILAAAGLHRMGLGDKIKQYLPNDEFVPSAGQGILCIEYLRGDQGIHEIIKSYKIETVERCADIERNFVKTLKGDCMSPIGVHASIMNKKVEVSAYVSSLDGAHHIKAKQIISLSEKENAGEMLAKLFLKQGARKLLKS